MKKLYTKLNRYYRKAIALIERAESAPQPRPLLREARAEYGRSKTIHKRIAELDESQRKESEWIRWGVVLDSVKQHIDDITAYGRGR